MKRLIVAASIAMTALLVHAQDVKTVLDNRTNGYKQELAKVDADVKKQQEAWPDQYLQALNTLAKKFTKDGDLDKVLLVRQEIDRFNKTKQAPEEAIQAPIELASLQAQAIRMPQSIEAGRRKQIGAATARHIDGLEELKKRLTQQGKIEDALKVNDEISVVKTRAESYAAQPVPQDSVAEKIASEEKKTSPETVAAVASETTSAATPLEPIVRTVKKGNSPIGKWLSHPPDMPDVKLIMALHEDGRFDQDQESQEWGGTFKFLNDEHTKVERDCRNGSVFILEYNPSTDEMTQNDGAPYIRATE
jgi:hypothetical protein